MKALGTNPNALAKVLGIGDSTVRNYIDRESKPGYEVLEKLYHSFEGINLDWLFGAPGEPLVAGVADQQVQYQNPGKNSGNIVGNISGGKNKFTTLADCAKENEHLRMQVAQLKSQLDDKERTIQILLGKQP